MYAISASLDLMHGNSPKLHSSYLFSSSSRERGAAKRPGSGALVSQRQAEDADFVPGPADELKPDRQTQSAGSTGNRDGRQTGQVAGAVEAHQGGANVFG